MEVVLLILLQQEHELEEYASGLSVSESKLLNFEGNTTRCGISLFLGWMRSYLKVLFNIIRDHLQFSEDEFTNSTLGERGKIVCILIFAVLGFNQFIMVCFVVCMR